jgi:hypothetical protein
MESLCQSSLNSWGKCSIVAPHCVEWEGGKGEEWADMVGGWGVWEKWAGADCVPKELELVEQMLDRGAALLGGLGIG